MVIKNKKYIISILLTIFLINCTFKQDMNRLSYYEKFGLVNQKNIRFDGFFYNHYENRNEYLSILIFYNNGRVFTSAYWDIIDSLLAGDLQLAISDWSRSCQWCWGAYIISNDTLKCQFLSPGRLAYINKRQIDESWFLINKDTSLFLIREIHHNETIFGDFIDTFNINKNYYFKKSRNKPDSLNSLMDIY